LPPLSLWATIFAKCPRAPSKFCRTAWRFKSIKTPTARPAPVSLNLASNGVSGSPRFAVALLNKGDVPVDMTVDFKLLSSLLQAARVFDVWAQTLLGTFNTQYEYPLCLPFTRNVTLLSCTPQKPFHLMVKSPAAGPKSKRVCSFELTQQSQAALTSYWRPFTRRQYVTNLTPVQVNCVPVSILRFRRFGRVAQTTPPASWGPQAPAIDASAARNFLRDFCSAACRVLPAPSARCGSPACVRASVPSEMECVPIGLCSNELNYATPATN
jgi:hypothetical protein